MAKVLKLLFLALAFVVFAAACTVAEVSESTPAEIPTSHPFFGDIEEAEELDPLGSDLPPVAPISTVEPLAEESVPEAVEIPAENEQSDSAAESNTPAAPTLQPEGKLFGGQSISATNFYTITIFDDQLNENWSIDNSQWVTTTLNSETAYQGEYSLAWHPFEDFGSIFFTVERNDDVQYLRSQAIGFRFWLSGGENWVERDDLAITAIGSNQSPYWAPNDYSVRSRLQPVFSETRLQFLNLNQDIPPGEWAPIILILNDLQFDPPYQFITGFYLKNDRGVLYPIYIDNVELIMVREESDSES
jgi:hypothetical protein